MNDELLRLAERCEAASGPDRELDREICQIIRGKQYRWAEFGGLPGYQEQQRIAVEQEPGWLTEDMREWWFERSEMGVLPAYTKSVDAAMTLVPEGWNWGANLRAHQGDAQAWAENGKLAFVGTSFRPNPERQWFDTVAATPALALTAAALRARASRLRMEVE